MRTWLWVTGVVDGREEWKLTADADWQRATARRVWLEASAGERRAIVQRSVRLGFTPDEVILRDVEKDWFERQGAAVPVCLGCGEALPPFSRRTTHNGACRQRLSRRRRASG